MKIKTYPLQFTEEELTKIKKKAATKGMTIKEFMLTAIKDKMEV